jgi:hypothetical protein
LFENLQVFLSTRSIVLKSANTGEGGNVRMMSVGRIFVKCPLSIFIGVMARMHDVGDGLCVRGLAPFLRLYRA